MGCGTTQTSRPITNPEPIINTQNEVLLPISEVAHLVPLNLSMHEEDKQPRDSNGVFLVFK